MKDISSPDPSFPRKKQKRGKSSCFIECPYCGANLSGTFEKSRKSRCFCCGRRVAISSSPSLSKAIQLVPEPLYLPKGSIRAIVTVTLALACWILMLKGRPVPGYLYGLILTVIGYYFAFRHKEAQAGEESDTDMKTTVLSNTGSASSNFQKPLYLPSGMIRNFLIGGFLISGIFAFSAGFLSFRDLECLEFYVIITGLIAGFIFRKVFHKSRGLQFYNIVNHIKGSIVILAAFALFIILLSGMAESYIYLSILISCLISFYFGTRS